VTDLSDLLNPGPRPHRILYFDVETSPMSAWIWDLKQNGYIPPSMVTQHSYMLCWAAKWSDGDEVMGSRLTGPEAKAGDDRRLVDKLADLIRQADVVIGHNGDRFDLPKLNARLLVHGLDPLGHVTSFDTLKAARSSFKLASNKLDELARALGLDGKHSTSFRLWTDCMAGNVPALKEMDAYCRQDVVLLEEVFDRLRPYVKRLPRLVDAGQFGQRCCPSCGSAELTPDGVHRTNASTYARFRCGRCGRRCRSFRQANVPKLEMRPL
jgi:DNA polymerase elongation subunit (family B)